jgi:hypothetical protein
MKEGEPSVKPAYVRLLSGIVIVVTGLSMGVPRPTPLRAQAQAPERLPSFDVASVKRNTSGEDRMRMVTQPGGRLIVTNAPLRGLIATAFDMADSPSLVRVRTLGGPDWVDSERYDINAKASIEFQGGPNGPPRELLLMMRSLLEERFKLVTHREAREMPIFELVVARKDGRLGPGLHNLGWTPDRLPTAAPPPGIPPVDPNGPPLVTALQEQLGLKVEAAKVPVDVLVIDSVEHPTPD